MLYKLYAVRDSKVGFMMPTVELNDAVAQRNFAYAVNNNGTMNYSPNDFDLFRLGTYDTDNAKIVLDDIPELVVSGSSVVGA